MNLSPLISIVTILVQATVMWTTGMCICMFIYMPVAPSVFSAQETDVQLKL